MAPNHSPVTIIIHPSSSTLMTMEIMYLVAVIATTILVESQASQMLTPDPSPRPWLCRRLCTCVLDQQSELYSANCSHRGLTEVPSNIPAGFHQLDLSYNQIRKIHGQPFIRMKFLISLKLSCNEISEMAESSFDGLFSLRELRLDGNRLEMRLNNPPFEPLVFSQLQELQVLHLYQNNLACQDPCGYPDQALSHLGELQEISLNGLPDKDFGHGFRNLSHLQKLTVGSDEYVNCTCSMPTISNQTFLNLEPTNLTHLYLLNCGIETIHPDGFQPLKNIHTLEMHRACLTFSKLKTALTGLSESPIKVLNLTHIEGEMELVLPERVFEPLINTSLTDLIFRYNWISRLEDHFPRYLPISLEKLDVSQNGIVEGPQGWVVFLPVLVNLRVFNASYQALHSRRPDEGSLPSKPHIPTLNSLPATSNYNYSASGITDDHVGMVVVGAPRNLEYIYLQNCNINLKHVPPVNFTKNKIKYADLSGNNIKFKGPLYNLHRLKYADFSHANSDVLNRDFFIDMPRLEKLLLNNNHLNCLSMDTDGETFRALSKLRYLDLSQNGIEQLSKAMFLEQYQLQTLLLHSNYLIKWKSQLGHMINMTYLDLSKNRLTTLGESARNDLDKVMKNAKFRINLLRNPIQCSCDGMDFLKWLHRRREFFQYFEKYECMLPDQTNTTLADLPKTINQLQRDCTSGKVLIAAAVSLASLLTVVFSAGCVYRHRWQMRYFKNRLALRLQLYQPLLEENDNFDQNYDCFLSYHENQHEFISDRVYPILEEHHGFKLCIHSRDFIPGIPVAANIYRAIHSSQVTIPFITESYFQSEWCVYELKMAYLESVHMGQQLLLPVLMEPMDFTQMSTDIQKIFKYITYLEYSLTTEDEFFCKLVEALQSMTKTMRA